MRFLSMNDVQELMTIQEYPCISLYLDLSSPASLQAGLQPRLHSQLGHIRKSMAGICHRSDSDRLLQPLYAATQSLHLLPTEAEGLALFRSFRMSGIFPTSVPVTDYLAVSDSFHLKPILPMIQGQTVFYVITLTQTSLTLFRGDRNGLKQLKTIELSESEAHEKGQKTGRAKVRRLIPRGRNGRYSIIHYQSPARLSRFFQNCQTVMNDIIQKRPGPTVTVGSAYLRRMFAQHCKVPDLLQDGINFRYSQGNHTVLHRKAVEIVEHHFNQRALILADQYLELQTVGRASNNIAEIAGSVLRGRVSHILVSKDCSLYGRLDRGTGRVINLQPSLDPIGDDVLCDLAQEVILRGGHAHVIPQILMPTSAPVAALYRW